MNNLTDNDILDGLRRQDEYVTRENFYGICRIAYCICDRRYSLSNKLGMDFYSLAHEYYLTLYTHDWRPLEDRRPEISLRSWMINGFRFLVLDRLKHARRADFFTSLDDDTTPTGLRFDIADSNFDREVRDTVEELCNTAAIRSHRAKTILRGILIDGYKGKEIAKQLGITPAAVSQQFQKLMSTVVIPYFKSNYEFSTSIFECCKLSICPPMPKPSVSASRFTPSHITHLADNEIFVFGSNLAGMHGGGAARTALQLFGAKLGVGVGPQGQSYAIPTMQGGVDTIRPYVDDFIAYAKQHPDKKFLVTAIGCGIAGFSVDEIAPLFREAFDVENISLPEQFWDVLRDSPHRPYFADFD